MPPAMQVEIHDPDPPLGKDQEPQVSAASLQPTIPAGSASAAGSCPTLRQALTWPMSKDRDKWGQCGPLSQAHKLSAGLAEALPTPPGLSLLPAPPFLITDPNKDPAGQAPSQCLLPENQPSRDVWEPRVILESL